MARTFREYRLLLQSLLPKGIIWNRSETSDLTKLLDGLGYEFSRVDDRSENLINESHPLTTVELLEEFEDDFAIPESGFSLETEISERQNVIFSKYTAIGGQYKEYFISLGNNLGWTITITENKPSWAGDVKAGEECGNQNVLFYWIVNIVYTSTTKVNISTLINYIEKRKPAHTECLFRFYGIDFDRSFSNAFDAIPWWDGSWYPYSFDRNFGISFANAYDYDGVNLIGSFDKQFSLAFYAYRGGAFGFDEFGDGFLKPN